MLLAGHGEIGPGTQEEASGHSGMGRQGAHSHDLHTAISPTSPARLVTALVWRRSRGPGEGEVQTDNGTFWLGPGRLRQ